MKRALVLAALCVPAVLLSFVDRAEAAEADELLVPSVFGDHMVLQREAELPVWGWAEPGSEVSVSFDGNSHRATAGGDGRWEVVLPSMQAGGPYEMVIESGGETVAFEDVLVGEVWLCGGQSNMAWPLSDSDGSEAELSGPPDDMLRLMQVQMDSSNAAERDVTGEWSRAEGEVLGSFSGVGYFMGKRLREELGVPVGLIQSAVGGSSAEAWTTRPSLSSKDRLRAIVDDADRKQGSYDRAMAEWERRAERARANGEAVPPQPASPFSWADGNNPAALWNAMLRPLTPYAVRGAIWYQGESNVGRAEQYETLLPTMFEDWRSAFRNPDMPFGIVQLANYTDPFPNGGSWPELRQAQANIAEKDQHSGLVVTIDCGNPLDIHPTDKRTVGTRLANWALDDVYGHDLLSASPAVDAIEIHGNEVHIRFENAGEGLKTSDGEPPRGFGIKGEQGWWTWGSARIEGDTVIVTGRWINAPDAVHYAWHNNPEWANLCNSAGLPAVPFRWSSR